MSDIQPLNVSGESILRTVKVEAKDGGVIVNVSKGHGSQWCGGVSERLCQGSQEGQSVRDKVLEGKGSF
jgi:hypothetical protein